MLTLLGRYNYRDEAGARAMATLVGYTESKAAAVAPLLAAARSPYDPAYWFVGGGRAGGGGGHRAANDGRRLPRGDERQTADVWLGVTSARRPTFAAGSSGSG